MTLMVSEIDASEIVFHSIRHTSAGFKLRLSNGDLKAVQGDGGWNTPDMVTKRYAHILDEDRKSLAQEMEMQFYQRSKPVKAVAAPKEEKAETLNPDAIAQILSGNPDLLMKVLQSVQSTVSA